MNPVGSRNTFGIPYARTGPAVLVRTINQILAALDAVRVVQGGTVTPTGTVITPSPGAPTSRRPAAAPVYPFQVTLSDTSDPAAPKVTISPYSRLYLALGTTATNITGIQSSPAEITLTATTRIWLSCTVSDLAVTAASIQSGTAWPALIVTSGSPAEQTQFNVPIGRVMVNVGDARPGFAVSISGSGYWFEQCLFNHLLVESRCHNGTTALYAFPWSGAV